MTTRQKEELDNPTFLECKHCRNQINFGAKICTHCGKTQNLFLSKLLTLGSISGGVSIVIAALTYALVTLPELFAERFVQDEISVVLASVDEDSYFTVLQNNISNDVFVDAFEAYFPTKANPTSSFTVGISKVLAPNEIWSFESPRAEGETHLSDCGKLTTIGRSHVDDELSKRIRRFVVSPMSTECMLARLVYPAEKFLENVALHYGGYENIVSFEHELYISYFSTRHSRRELLQIDSAASILADRRYRGPDQ